jgi:hypothetical protein
MTENFAIETGADRASLPPGDYPAALSSSECDELRRAVGVIDALWFLEESYDVLLQNGIEFEIAVARLEANQRANLSSFPDEADLEIRLLNRLLTNFLASARAFLDSINHRLSSEGGAMSAKLAGVKASISAQFDAEFSYRLMDALRNHTQHRAAPIGQTLTTIRTWRSTQGQTKDVLAVSPQIERDRLVRDGKIRSSTRTEIARDCDAMIDVLPHLATYLRCFGRIVEGARLLYEPEYRSALLTHANLLKDHMADEWATVWVTSQGNSKPDDTLVTGSHELRRLERIRLRNVARDPASV